MLIRLLQNFSSIKLDADAHPPELASHARGPPPKADNPSRRSGLKRIWPCMSMYVTGLPFVSFQLIRWRREAVGRDGRSKLCIITIQYSTSRCTPPTWRTQKKLRFSAHSGLLLIWMLCCNKLSITYFVTGGYQSLASSISAPVHIHLILLIISFHLHP